MQSRKDIVEFERHVAEQTDKNLGKDTARGFAFYLSFMIWDFYASPENYPTLWAIRLSVVLIFGLIVYNRQHPFIKKHRRPLYVASLIIIMNSVAIIWSIKNPAVLPPDASLVSLVLIFAMSAFRLRTKDAMLLGTTYCTSFLILLSWRNSPPETWHTYFLALGAAFVMGTIGAYHFETKFYALFSTEKRLREETERADNLLAKTFPTEIAKELKLNYSPKAKRFDQVTIMFCDIANFTESSTNMPPEDLVTLLNNVYSKFDSLAEQFGCEKIKTVGDSYMAVCGAPTPRTDHAQQIVRLAIAINAAAQDFHLNGAPLSLRIGISTGPAVAGVIGKNKFSYDLWGDCVNTASRMEALSTPGKILLTESTKNHLGNTFLLEKISALDVKGKGSMDAWQVIGYKHELKKEETAA